MKITIEIPDDELFQSTPSVGRATGSTPRSPAGRPHFNPRPPWGGRHETKTSAGRFKVFQSTPSVGRATPVES